jgi:hypothetical protein
MIIETEPFELRMNAAYASTFAALALAHVTREYPNKLDHVLLESKDVQSPRALHPIFFGSFDWHSCVHGYWLLATVLRQYPQIAEAAQIRALFDAQLTSANVAIEAEYASHVSRGGFERPYGWAWLLMLQAELLRHSSSDDERWSVALQPLADVFVTRVCAFLPKATYPVRVGTHYNTAFALVLVSEYVTVARHASLHAQLQDAARRWYTNDANANAWEPSGDDFLSSTLIEAACMQRLTAPLAFRAWFDAYLPALAQRLPASLFAVASVSDRSDGKIAHLDGLNLSRAWCWRLLASSLPLVDERRAVMLHSADTHLRASLNHVAGDYMGEHWLATFALLALNAE